MKKIIFGLVLFAFTTHVSAQKNRLISDIQGDKNFSAYVGEIVRVNGIVTARVRNGFFLQTPDNKVDANPLTSEGIFVFTKTEPEGEATVGNFVSITGRVDEYAPSADPNSMKTTQIVMTKGRDFIAVESKGMALPKPVVITADDFKPGSIDQLEKFEGMRVAVPELMVVAPTDGKADGTSGTSQSDGVFYAILNSPGARRPFREIGYSVYDFLMLTEKEKDKLRKQVPKMALFDHNPERLRIESEAQLGAQPIDVPAYSTIKGLTGVMGYAWRAYSILVDPDNKPEVAGLMRAKALPAPSEKQFSIAAANIEQFFDEYDEPETKEPIISPEGFARRLKKISMAVRLYMNNPDVVAVTEAESLTVLKRLAEAINKDSEATGKPNPLYDAFLIEGNDISGIDSGFLVKRSRVDVLELLQFGKNEKFRNPTTKEDVALNDRPPLLLRAAIKTANGPFEFTVIVNHMKSFRGYTDEKEAPFVQLKKRLQAEFLARFAGERQKANPSERIALVGDFNFYQFNDGIMDVIGTIKGSPAPADSVQNAAEDLVNPDLLNLVDLIPAETRYSFVFDGNAQVIDQFIVNEVFRKHIAGFGFAHLNADYPEIYRNDPNRVERFSDHDAAVAFFNF
jgi:predicted extracellular nuclease